MNEFTVPNICISSGWWKFEGHRACAIDDTLADLVIKDAYGKVLADITVRRLSEDENITVSVMNVGTALMWSHIRWLEAPK